VTPERTKKIAMLKEAIQTGRYAIDSEALADAIIRRARERQARKSSAAG
jgi:anti-sigma28 factor (negative regulator of flagellin synthesis)